MSEQNQRPRSPLESERGSTSVAETVVSKIAGAAVGEVEGVYMGSSTSRAAGGFLGGLPGSQGQTRGISVEVGMTEAAIDLTMGIEYGKNILQIIERVRERITERVQNLTGLRITELNATVTDIVFPEDGIVESGIGSSEDSTQVMQAEEVGASRRERGRAETARRAEAMNRPGETDRTEEVPQEDETFEMETGDERTRRRERRERGGGS